MVPSLTPFFMTESSPLVSCVMITANRGDLVRRSVQCFSYQTYPNRELIVIDDGNEDLEPILQRYVPGRFTYVRLEKKEGQNLGFLRNLGLDKAKGEFIAQWDDDDWYHPDRLAAQISVLETGFDACCLQATLMHLNIEPYLQHPYVGILPNGVPGTIVHRNDPAARYPLEPRGEDTTFLDFWMKRRYRILPLDMSHLFIRCFHGNNTWEQIHFTRRVRNNLRDTIGYFWHAKVRGNLFGHRRFRLSNIEQDTFEKYFAESRKLGLF
jgi:glycosyltransferase involved in cell wall biosynthesis